MSAEDRDIDLALGYLGSERLIDICNYFGITLGEAESLRDRVNGLRRVRRIRRRADRLTDEQIADMAKGDAS